MAFTADEQELYDFGKKSVPRWLFGRERTEEEFNAFVKMFDTARANIAAQFDQALITQATGAAPGYLDQHAADRGTSRLTGETDAQLRDRLRNFQDEVTRPALLAAVQEILTRNSIAGAPYMMESRRDGVYLGSLTGRTGEGGTFATVAGDTKKFTPTVPFIKPMEVDFPRSGSQGNPRITFAGAASGGNNGTFEVTALDGDAVVYTNAAGVDGADSGVDWSTDQRDVESNVRSGFPSAYATRGYRIRSRGASFAVIVPPATTATAKATIEETLRAKKAAGAPSRVEQHVITVPTDGPDGWYLPQTEDHFRQLSLIPPEYLIANPQESGSGDGLLYPRIDRLGYGPMQNVGTSLFQQTVVNWNALFVGHPGGSLRAFFTALNTSIALGESFAILGYFSFTTPAGNDWIFGRGDDWGLQVTSSGFLRAKFGVATNGAVDHSGLANVRMAVIYRDATADQSGVVSNLESFTGTHEEAARAGTVGMGDVDLTLGTADYRLTLFAVYKGKKAEQNWSNYLAALRP